MSENVPSDISAQRRFRSACAFAQSDLNLRWAHFGKPGFEVSSCGQRILWAYCVVAQADLNLRWAHMSEGVFSLYDSFGREIAFQTLISSCAQPRENNDWRVGRDGPCQCQSACALFAQSDKALTLRKHAYSNLLKILQPKQENFPIKKSDIFHISSQNIDCGYSFELPHRGGSNEYPQSMFFNKIRKNNVYPCKPQFYYIKVGFI